MQKNILITGASGFIGSFLVEEAIRRGYRVFAGIRASSSRKYLTDPAIHFLELDMSDAASMTKTLTDAANTHGAFDYVVHAAGITKSLHLSEYYEVNVASTERLVTVLQQAKLLKEKFVFVSSLASYGPGTGRNPITALSTPNPITAYGRSKREAENLLYKQTDLPFLIINPTAVYGPRDKDFLFVLQTVQQKLELYVGSREQLLSFVHVMDLVKAIFLATESTLVQQNFLVSDLANYSTAEMNRIIKQQLGVSTFALTVPGWIAVTAAVMSEAVGNLRGKVPLLNRERLKEFRASNWAAACTELTQLGYQPDFDLEKGLADTISWYRSAGLLK